jgi:hypothetical protein
MSTMQEIAENTVDDAIIEGLKISVNACRNDTDTGIEIIVSLWYRGEVVSESKVTIAVD